MVQMLAATLPTSAVAPCPPEPRPARASRLLAVTLAHTCSLAHTCLLAHTCPHLLACSHLLAVTAHSPAPGAPGAVLGAAAAEGAGRGAAREPAGERVGITARIHGEVDNPSCSPGLAAAHVPSRWGLCTGLRPRGALLSTLRRCVIKVQAAAHVPAYGVLMRRGVGRWRVHDGLCVAALLQRELEDAREAAERQRRALSASFQLQLQVRAPEGLSRPPRGRAQASPRVSSGAGAAHATQAVGSSALSVPAPRCRRPTHRCWPSWTQPSRWASTQAVCWT